MDDRLRVVAVIHALKASGVRVKNWKNFLNGPYTSDPVRQENQSKFAFGRDLILLPQCDLTDMSGTVPKFLVDACEFLSQHLHTEGLFRKTGSFSRMRALRAGLEQGEPVFSLPHSATLQPCDVASLVKQFLRELPLPLIPIELQVPLCRAQGLEEEEEGGQEQGKDGALLLTALFPPSHSRALRYFCTFLRQTAQRCKENRMEVGNLALVIAPNLLHCPAGGSKLTAGTERRLHRQAAVIKKLIIHADRIGVVPPSIMDMATVAESSTPPVDGGRFQERAGLGVYRLLAHQRRRSVGEIFVDALSKLKTGRTHTGLLHPPDSQQNTKTAHHKTPESPVTSKRKSTEDPVPDVESSAKKRRSIHDLREDNQSMSKQPSNVDSEAAVGQSPTRCHTSVLSGVEGSREHELSVTLTAPEKRRNHKKDYKTSNKHPGQEDKAHRRTSLRFFNMTIWSSPDPSPTSIGNDTENWIMGNIMVTDGMTEASSSEIGPSRIPVIMTDGMTEASSSEVGPSRIPVIMTDGMTEASSSEVGPARIPVIMTDCPGQVGNEVEDDPDLLNYSFAENPDHFLDLATLDSPIRTQAGESCECSGVKLENETIEETVRRYETNHVLRGPEQVGIKEDPKDVGLSKKQSEVDISVSQKPRHPRRSISMPEVTLDQLRIQDEIYKKEKTDWMIEKEDGVSEDTLQLPVKKGKVTESGLGFKRTHQHMSVAERIRRFNALTTLLRNPRVPPRPPEPQLNDVLHESQREGGQRSVVRLRRQGARRFGRSISHDGVPGPWPGQASKNHQEVPVVVQSLSEPVLCPPPEPALSVYPFAQEGQFEIQHTPQLQQENLMQTIQDLCAPPSPNPKQNKESCQGLFKESQLNLKERQLEPVEEQPKESELHDDLLEMHLNTCNPKEEQEKRITVPMQVNRPFLTDTVLDVPPQTMAPLQQESKSTEVKLPLPFPSKPSPLSQTETCSPIPSGPSPTPLDRTSTDLYTAHLVANCSLSSVMTFGFIEIDMGVSDGGSVPVELSPSPVLQFRLPATKRRYRDSPCWPVHEISMATGDTLQI
ncbi:uncharacterized protein LOC115154754 isoform X1 [Salmo trutta]|uniref:uncharacterized protein LOC115154754 isoform X1 n=1 Tax=Salmo trutta TaxID=8032 RepID=UPI00112FF5A4|nr:uncharacterized protein LOC115154754 isoform X1 [Salmo trutta]XP_029557156.1 uncharacterized protein LOC115154754 isoform X1 [Salmo trutta]